MTAVATEIARAPAHGRAGRLAALVLLLGAAAVTGVALGSSSMTLDRLLPALVGQGAETDRLIVWGLRAPRVLLSALAGMALALAGLLLQRATRNPLAAPTVLGISDGAALGAVGFLFLFSDSANSLTVSIYWQPVAAAVGAAVFAVLVAVLARGAGGGPVGLVLHGFALGALAKAGVTLLMIVGPVYRASQASIWLAGSVHEARWSDVVVLASLMALILPVLLILTARMDQLLVDDSSAEASGLPVRRTQALLIALAVVLTASAVSFVGAIGFVGLVAPHAARLLVGTRALPAIAASALVGAAMVVLADIVVRLAFAPLEVPTGAATALIGAPYFLFILFRTGRAHA
ncbi:FecCD family ABC transporter permease [Chelativorans salis]|uniref:Iron ABC transporter permease n=1 Tax=Chelativorans salis TaxID=2978478 RepID=A0ABT2LN78_9HYPH|nr:iron ABC transporter permease [Chelativorans sp. EGI FJ00035]MCT7376010.1 iron ABC transporter permease [Chelativorans sp. EGI FJ00035]